MSLPLVIEMMVECYECGCSLEAYTAEGKVIVKPCQTCLEYMKD